MTAYSALTASQRARAAYLFADETFGTDPRAYEYEVNGGEVVGRVKQTDVSGQPSAVHVRKPHTVMVNVTVKEVPETYITLEMNRNAQQAIKDIARHLVEQMIHTQEAAS